MEPIKRKRVRIGDIIEIPTSVGFAYAMYSHENDDYGTLLRVFDYVSDDGEEDAAKIVKKTERFAVFFPLGPAVSRGIFPLVGNEPVPPHLREFPLFRAAGAEDPKTGKVKIWWLWDGEKEWRIGDLSKKHRKLSIREAWNDTALIEAIEEGWRPENDPS